MAAIDWLLSGEWKMGNGQCPDCCGVHPGWYGHPCHLDADSIGHKKDCPRAKAIQELGGSPIIKGSWSPTDSA